MFVALALFGLPGCVPNAATGNATDSAAPVVPTCPALTGEPESFSVSDLVPAPETLRSPTGLAVVELDGARPPELVLSTMGGTVVLRWGEAGFERMQQGPFAQNLPSALGVAAADVNLDGHVDLALARWEGDADLFLLGDASMGFIPYELPQSTGHSRTPAFADLDGDSRLDLVVARGLDTDFDLETLIAQRTPGDPSSIYRWSETAFVEFASPLPQSAQDGYTFHAAPVDADADGDLDLWMANDFGPWIEPDLLLRNDGVGEFSVDPAVELAHFGMGVAVGDADRDGLADVYITDIGSPDLMVADGEGGFYDGTVALGADLGTDPGRMASWATRFTDFNGDNLDDIAVAFGKIDDAMQEDIGLVNPEWSIDEEQHDAILLSTPSGGFVDAGDSLGMAAPVRHRAMVVADLDDDLIPEIINAGKDTLTVYHLAGGCSGRAVLELVGNATSPAIGARVDVTAAGVQTTRWVLPSATGSSSATEVYFGLGEDESGEVIVTWPNGQRGDHSISAGERMVLSP